MRIKSFQSSASRRQGRADSGHPEDENWICRSASWTALPRTCRSRRWFWVICRGHSYAERHYSAPDGFDMTGTLVLMGADRTSIHKPDYCLPGQG